MSQLSHTYMLLAGIIVFCILVLWFVRALRRTTRLSEDATILVAYTKYAVRVCIGDLWHNPDEHSQDDKYRHLMNACYLMNKFYLKSKGLPKTYRFSINENGMASGKTFEVQLGPFLFILTDTLTMLTASLAPMYQERVDSYMRNPFSANSIAVSKAIEDRLYPKSKTLREITENLRWLIVETDFMYFLCK